MVKTEGNDPISKSAVSLLGQVVVCPLAFRKQDTVLFYFFLFLRYAKNLLGFCFTFLASFFSYSSLSFRSTSLYLFSSVEIMRWMRKIIKCY